jgi:hypothetical protein
MMIRQNPVRLSPQLTAFFTRAPILASSAAVNSFGAKAVGHMAPSSRFASCMKPNVAYRVLNFCALLEEADDLAVLAVVISLTEQERAARAARDAVGPAGQGHIHQLGSSDRHKRTPDGARSCTCPQWSHQGPYATVS